MASGNRSKGIFMDLIAGQAASTEKLIVTEGTRNFSVTSMDDLPIHQDAGYAAGTRSGQRVTGAAWCASIPARSVGDHNEMLMHTRVEQMSRSGGAMIDEATVHLLHER